MSVPAGRDTRPEADESSGGSDVERQSMDASPVKSRLETRPSRHPRPEELVSGRFRARRSCGEPPAPNEVPVEIKYVSGAEVPQREGESHRVGLTA